MAGETVRHIIVCETNEDVAPAKKFAEEQGGTIEETYTLFPGFTVLMPKDSISTFASSKHIKSAELDGVVRTQ